MFKGLTALFSTGLLFHPMVLSGIVAAFIAINQLDNNQIYTILKTSYVYIGIFVWALVYTFSFAKIYKEGGAEVDTFATFLRVIANTIRCVLAFVLTFSFAVMMSF